MSLNVRFDVNLNNRGAEMRKRAWLGGERGRGREDEGGVGGGIEEGVAGVIKRA